MWIKTILLIFVPLTAYASPGELPSKFEDANKFAIMHEADERSRCYYKCDFIPHYENNFQTVLQQCFKNITSPEVKSFDLIVVLGTSGVIVSSWLEPQTNIGLCLSSALEGSNFPKPPFAPYYAKINMQFSK